MNNYPNFKNYNYDNYNMNNFLNTNNISNKNIHTSNSMNYDKENKLYDPYNGLIRGNLFKNLYDPYKTKEPYEIKPMNEQADLLTYINALCFAMTDLNLYLDVYPEDRNAIELYNQYRKENESMLQEYESKYGPIVTNSDSLNSYPWSWDKLPWPWDN